MATGRRQFLSQTFSVGTAFSIAGAFSSLTDRLASGASSERDELVEVKDETTGLPLLKLPEGFRYKSFGWTRDPMSDGIVTPAAHDGMAVVQEENGVVTLVRNHEVSATGKTIADSKTKASEKGLKTDEPKNGAHQPYDAKAGGGCTCLTFDCNKGEWGKSWLGLNGTVRNCAGGVTPWGTWLTCEETLFGPGPEKNQPVELEKSHGWIFDVDPQGKRAPQPLTEMGRFVHEAIAIDRKTGIVYETEDRNHSGFYRFLPNQRNKLSEGGKLQMMKVAGMDDVTGKIPNGAEYDVSWVDIANPNLAHSPNTTDAAGVFKQGKKLGGTTFARLEGCWAGNDLIYFDATSGGAAGVGQIWAFDPVAQKVKMIFESPNAKTLNMPDNLCVSPNGGILICEDSDYGKYSQQRIHGLTQDGRLSLFAVNNIELAGERNGFKGNYRGKEWAGASFSPDGKWLFVNIQTPGITFAISGPWENTVF